eukprot:jgi/Psemu1/38484/gm1.38484_g
MEEIKEIAKEVLGWPEQGLRNLLHDNEAVEVDRGYRGDDKMKLSDIGFTWIERKMKSNAWLQHETVNGRLKIFNVLTLHFWHMKPNRQGMMHGETTFEDGLEYDVNYF